MRRFTALAGDITLLGPIHRRKTAIFLGHLILPPVPDGPCRRNTPNHASGSEPIKCNGSATKSPEIIDVIGDRGVKRMRKSRETVSSEGNSSALFERTYAAEQPRLCRDA
jgi:hypothetical protein